MFCVVVSHCYYLPGNVRSETLTTLRVCSKKRKAEPAKDEVDGKKVKKEEDKETKLLKVCGVVLLLQLFDSRTSTVINLQCTVYGRNGRASFVSFTP